MVLSGPPNLPFPRFRYTSCIMPISSNPHIPALRVRRIKSEAFLGEAWLCLAVSKVGVPATGTATSFIYRPRRADLYSFPPHPPTPYCTIWAPPKMSTMPETLLCLCLKHHRHLDRVQRVTKWRSRI